MLQVRAGLTNSVARKARQRMRLLLLPRYGPQGASSRYRIWQYVPLFERAGHQVVVRPLMDDGYIQELYSTGRRRWRWLASGYARRFLDAFRVGQFDAVICEQEVLPFLPDFVDLFFQRLNRRFFVDYDDDAQDKYSSWPILRRRIPHIMAAAETVVVGNSHLAHYAQQFTSHVRVIPTVVDLSCYRDRTNTAPSNTIRVAWIGTPVTATLLRRLIPTMKTLQARHPALRFCFIGAGTGFRGDGLNIEILPWSEQTEADLLVGCDIGIMPLPDNEFTRSKCGLKLIQYMASGLPVVASPVGVNREIVEDGTNGYLASSDDDWFRKLDRLIRNPDLRRNFGKAGRAKVAAGYTLEHGFSQWREVLAGNGIAYEHGRAPSHTSPRIAEMRESDGLAAVVDRE
jgi:glycosyltransferase involved in cell wall biosynthesis